MKISLHIGLNLVDPAAYNGWPGILKACVSDAAGMATMCARAGFSASTMLNEQATIDLVSTGIQQLAMSAQPGDTVLISYSGHGGQAGAWTLTGYRETLCLYDGQLADTEFLGLLGMFQPGVRVVVFFDSCHSGGMNRGMDVARAKPEWVRSVVRSVGTTDPRGLPPITASVLMWCACRQTEVAADGEVNGAFTGSLLGTWTQLVAENQLPTWLKWENATSLLMARTFPSQHPEVHLLGDESASLLNQTALA